MAFVTRFAPSPTGPLHLGHAYSAMRAHDMARAQGGRFLLRIEDTDRARCRPAWAQQIFDDLRWLGLSWEEPVLRQSDNRVAYDAALTTLAVRNLTYPCRCARADIRAALVAPQEGTDEHSYPGTCRARRMDERQPGDAIRLRLQGETVQFTETGAVAGRVTATLPANDPILARKATGDIAYLLACVVDDAAQGVTHVVRGMDLRDVTPLQVHLQHVLGLPTPVYHHHRLIRDDHGKRLAKRDDARSIANYRAEGATPQAIRRMVGLQTGSDSTTSAPSTTPV